MKNIVMKHIFIVNPKAGKKNHLLEITEKLKEYDGKIDYEIYQTKCVRDGFEYTKTYLENHPDDYVRCYACGGDGTLNEVCSGLVGYPNVELACMAIGSGNDFVKNYGTVADFQNLDALINGKPQVVDIIKLEDEYCLNICNFGFDAWVCEKMLNFKKLPLVSGPLAYDLGVLYCLLFKMKHYIKLEIDGEIVFDGKALLCAVSNGICYGGGYYCSPDAILDDGLANICLVKKVSLFRAAGLIKVYKAGKHINNPELADIIVYNQGKKITISSDKPLCYSKDGETKTTLKLNLELLPKMVKFIVPEGLQK